MLCHELIFKVDLGSANYAQELILEVGICPAMVVRKKEEKKDELLLLYVISLLFCSSCLLHLSLLSFFRFMSLSLSFISFLFSLICSPPKLLSPREGKGNTKNGTQRSRPPPHPRLSLDIVPRRCLLIDGIE